MKFESNIKLGRPFINYAHRGASEYAPENTMLAFMLGLTMGANGIETDVQKTKDNHLVLFHDDTLKRVTGKDGSIADYTLSELKTFWVSNLGLSDRIVTFDEFLSSFCKKKIHLCFELKVFGIAKDVVDKIFAYNMQDRCTITAFDYNNLLEVKKLGQNIKTGYLTTDVSDELVEKLLDDGITEICPNAKDCTARNVKKWHDKGLNVRAWGVANEDLMKSVYDSGADGMTVNFPDKLVDYIGSKISV